MPLTESQKTYQREYYLKNRDAKLAASKARSETRKAEKAEYDRARRLAQRDRLSELGKIRSKTTEGRITNMLSRARSRAKQSGIPCTITRDDIQIPTHCPILGIPLEFADTAGGDIHSPSLDRIVPELGYIPGNVQVISAKANLIKSNLTIDQLKTALEWAIKQSLHQP